MASVPHSPPPPQAVILMLEDGQDYCAAKMCGLLEYMATSAVLTRDQITQVCISVGSCLESTRVSFSQHLWYQCHAIKFYAELILLIFIKYY